MSEFTLITVENFHEIVPKYIRNHKLMISEYEDMTSVILKMIEDKYFFNFDKNILIGYMEDFTYLYSPNDDINKDRIVSMLEPSSDEDSDDELKLEELRNLYNNNRSNDDNNNRSSDANDDNIISHDVNDNNIEEIVN